MLQSLERANKTRIHIYHEKLSSPCVEGCGQWLRCFKNTLMSHNIAICSFSNALKELLHIGQEKYRNILITGTASCSKTFILSKFYKPGFLNDLRWSAGMIP